MSISIDNPIALLIICLLPVLLVLSIRTGIKKRFELIDAINSNQNMEKSAAKIWMPILLFIFMIVGLIYMVGWLCTAIFLKEIAFSRASIFIFVLLLSSSIILGDTYVRLFIKK